MRTILFILCLIVPLACAPEARWPQERDLQFASPAQTPVPQAMATAVDWWMSREPTALEVGPVPVYLAPSLQPAAKRLAKMLPSCDIVDSDEGDALAIRAVRMHASSAQIDLDAPRPGRGRQLITLDMQKFLFTPWEVTGANWWRFNDDQLERITSSAASQDVDQMSSDSSLTESADSTTAAAESKSE